MVQGPWLLAPGSRSTGLGKVVQETRGRFHVLEWGVFCHAERLRNRPARLKKVYYDKALSMLALKKHFDKIE
jgi:Holliday junction resolvasome RuvABC endonuclease subunit